MTEPYRVALIGCGRAGLPRAHAFEVHPSCRMVAVADTDAENLAFAKQAFDVPGYGDWASLFEHHEVDIALAILPVSPNADAVVAAAEAGARAIFCEKPLTARLRDADRMVDACASRNVHLAAGVMVSSHPDYIDAFRRVEAGDIGDVLRIHLYDDNGQGGCHGMNLTRKFAGKRALESATGWAAGDPHSDHEEPYDEATTGFGALGGVLRFTDGIRCFSHAPVPWRGIEVVGSEGVIVNRNNSSLGLQLFGRDGDRLVEVPDLFEQGPWPEREFDEHGWRDAGDPMRNIVTQMVGALDEDEPLSLTTGQDLRHALEMALALRESARRDGAPVDLPLADRELAFFPERSRWHYKKDVYGEEWYREQLHSMKRDGR